MAERTEELPVEVLQAEETLARVYRMSETFQVILYVILAALGIGLIYRFSSLASESLMILVALFYLAILFPIIIKVQNVRRYAFGLGLRLSTIGGVIYVVVAEYKPSTIASRSMFVLTVLILLFELYQHLIGIYPKKKAYLRLTIGLSTLAFAAASYVLFVQIFSIPISLGVSLFLAILFARAIRPERSI